MVGFILETENTTKFSQAVRAVKDLLIVTLQSLKGACRKDRVFLQGPGEIGQKEIASNRQRVGLGWI